uniref:Protein FAR1-RELATED SEQUENCE n=1 Tax=Aegilops tauschii subsp. strangulata TaxID=200361 RepID=A0A452Y2W8_AEGTS
MLTIDEFDEAWNFLPEKYHLKTHPYMMQLYEIRHKWAKPYFKRVFCAKMTSKQRIESANHMLKNYVHPGCQMHMFVVAELAANYWAGWAGQTEIASAHGLAVIGAGVAKLGGPWPMLPR